MRRRRRRQTWFQTSGNIISQVYDAIYVVTIIAMVVLYVCRSTKVVTTIFVSTQKIHNSPPNECCNIPFKVPVCSLYFQVCRGLSAHWNRNKDIIRVTNLKGFYFKSNPQRSSLSRDKGNCKAVHDKNLIKTSKEKDTNNIINAIFPVNILNF